MLNTKENQLSFFFRPDLNHIRTQSKHNALGDKNKIELKANVEKDSWRVFDEVTSMQMIGYLLRLHQGKKRCIKRVFPLLIILLTCS